MTITLIPIIVCLVGLCLYVLVPNAKAQEVGRLMFAIGLLAVLLGTDGHAAIRITG